jgi:hypothetical protein
MHAGVVRLSRVEGAKRVFAEAHGRGAEPAGLLDAAVVDVQPNGRIVVRGTAADGCVDVSPRLRLRT